MPENAEPLLSESFLISRFAADYQVFQNSEMESDLLQRLKLWSTRDFHKESSAEADFIDIFFRQTWGYWGTGTRDRGQGFTMMPKFAIPGAGEGGGTGIADMVLGWFRHAAIPRIPQVVCEFKDVRSDLDKAQHRKGSARSPVRQCADYLREAAKPLYGNEPIQPTWGLISDMNEFRLYFRKTMPSQYQRFILKRRRGLENTIALTDEGEEARFQRFLFWKLLSVDMLLSRGTTSRLEQVLIEQGHRQQEIQNSFYREYQAFRESIFRSLQAANPSFRGTRGKLVRLTQRFLDRCIFILFCEDMGTALRFTPNLLRDLLSRESMDPHYEPNDLSAWHKVKRLFIAMRDGTPFGDTRVNRFNGGLFAEEAELEALAIPNSVFCTKGQGANSESIIHTKNTLLYFSAHYNFGVRAGQFERSIGLYTLGRIFEQSITDLEFMEAKADGRPSLTELSKRKRDGVYYTPEWVTYFIVEETIGAHLRELRRKYDIDDGSTFTDEELSRYQLATSGKRSAKRSKPPEAVLSYLKRLDEYAGELSQIKVLDPACGSGAFLIQALDRLVQERRWVSDERERITVSGTLFDIDKITKAVLAENIHGVDINAESVEITRLALWLHSALPDRPLCTLDENIRCGNSLVGQDFYQTGQMKLFTEEEKERINVFDYAAAFPSVFSRDNGRSGFDCIVGNPPYVKLQNLMQVDPEVARYLTEAIKSDGRPRYESTQTKNFDLYLPFIERGIELLNREGRMGYIAPSVWVRNEYGLGLRKQLFRTQSLERWIDFRDYQVFDESITYTALQFFRGRPSPVISCRFAPDGKVAGTEWSQADAYITYGTLAEDEAWTFLPAEESDLIARLSASALKLSDPTISDKIFQGIKTGADNLFVLAKIGTNLYRFTDVKGSSREVEIEDALMRPVMGGTSVRRYELCIIEQYVVFPYAVSGHKYRLLAEGELASQYPKGMAYLRSHEAILRAREKGRFDNERWYDFSRPQNIDAMYKPKLLIAGTAPGLRVTMDKNGAFAFLGGRVHGVHAVDPSLLPFLLAVLNSPVADFVFRRKARPKAGGYFESETQFLAPLPLPRVNADERAWISEAAEKLEGLHTKRRDCIEAVNRRLYGSQTKAESKEPSWFWADIEDLGAWKKKAPEALQGKERTFWAKDSYSAALAKKVEVLNERLHRGARLSVRQQPGELGIDMDGVPLISGIFVDEDEAPFIAAQWRHKLRGTAITESFSGEKLMRILLELQTSANKALKKQVIELDAQILRVNEEIADSEQAMNEMLYRLYGLSKSEQDIVEADRPQTNA